MPNKVKQLRGTDAEWAENDIVIDDGEIALAISPTGRYRMKIGNGKKKFSELEMFGGEVKKSNGTVFSIKHSVETRMGELAELMISAPNTYDEDIYALLTFDSGEVPTSLSYITTQIRFTGRSVIGENFIPEPNMHYTAIFWYDGKFQCHVRGVENA